MQKFNLSELITKALDEMKRHGASTKQQDVYRTTGFGSILRYFSSKNVTEINTEMLDDYLNIMHTGYLLEHYSEWKWRLVRRGKELLALFMCCGFVDLKPLRPWNHSIGKESRSVILDTPTADQLQDPNNLFAVVWRIRQTLYDAGYTESSIKHYTSEGLTVILRKHYESGLETYSESLTNEIICDKRLDYEKGKTSRQSFQNLRKAALFIDSFVKTGNIDLTKIPSWNKRELSSIFEKQLNSFCNLMIKEYRLKTNSVNTLNSAVRNFLFKLESMGIFSFERLDQLTVNHCITFIAPKYPCGAGGLLYATRLFLKYLYEANVTSSDLSSALPKTFAVKKTFHEPFSADELELLLSAPDRNTSVGSRDYAMMLLALKTGLRACDIVNLKREDIAWRSKQINIVQQKTGVAVSLPLPIEAGNAIAEYLLKYRPESSLPYVFLCKSRTVRKFASRSACATVTKYMKLTGLYDSSKRRGFHSLRRSFGTALLDNEIPMELIQQLLGQTQMNSMKPYLSVNESGLKQCALSLACATGKEALV